MKTKTRGIRLCKRCGEQHLQVYAKKFENPPEPYTHWATCPVTGDPILIEATPEELAEDAALNN